MNPFSNVPRYDLTNLLSLICTYSFFTSLMLLFYLYYFPVTEPLAGRVTAVICVVCATFTAVGGLRAIVSIGMLTFFLSLVGTALPTGLALLPTGFKRMWEIASHGERLVLYE